MTNDKVSMMYKKRIMIYVLASLVIPYAFILLAGFLCQVNPYFYRFTPMIVIISAIGLLFFIYKAYSSYRKFKKAMLGIVSETSV